MFNRFVRSGNVMTKEVRNFTYRNSRIVVLKNEQATALPYEARIDCARETVRFKTADAAVDYATRTVDASREALALEQARDMVTA
jgi:hypothetical protein